MLFRSFQQLTHILGPPFAVTLDSLGRLVKDGLPQVAGGGGVPHQPLRRIHVPVDTVQCAEAALQLVVQCAVGRLNAGDPKPVGLDGLQRRPGGLPDGVQLYGVVGQGSGPF